MENSKVEISTMNAKHTDQKPGYSLMACLLWSTLFSFALFLLMEFLRSAWIK